MDSGEVRAGEHSVADAGRIVRRQHVDHAGRQARSFEQVHQEGGAVDGALGGLPDHRVAHQGGREAKIARDGGEVKGRGSEHEAVETAILKPVLLGERGQGLHRLDLLGECDIEP